MGCHLDRLIEEMKAGNVTCTGQLQTAIRTRMEREFAINAPQAICFDAGEYDDVAAFKPIAALIRLPFPVCWVEVNFDGDGLLRGGRVGALCYYVEESLVFQVFGSQEKSWFFMYEIKPLGVGEFEFIRDSVYYGEDGIMSVCFIILSFISALNCSNINRIEHAPSEKLQKARARRGKQPLFSYWTLEIDLPKSKAAGSDMGGTHASPRLHLRRGHPREYAPGRWCWVQPHVVGNKTAGMVHKEYAARYPAKFLA